MQFLTAILKFFKDTFDAIEIDFSIEPSDTLSAEIQVEVETGEYVYSYRWDRWFHSTEIAPLETTWGTDEAAITYDGLILFAFECVWEDGVTVSDVEIPTEKPAQRIFRYDTAATRNNLAYEMGY